MTRHKQFFTVDPGAGEPFQLVLTGFLSDPDDVELLKEALPAAIEEMGPRVEAMIINVGAAPWTVDAGGLDG